ncbi:PQQ-dependent sugar dehydrogenase [Bradymonas sediminis]|nr:sorbosone dehydrogenase family protein [Bradymonas sediminis]TDP62877.1 glucose/arabinose dehydrogenase [Bradymonas sediminis]
MKSLSKMNISNRIRYRYAPLILGATLGLAACKSSSKSAPKPTGEASAQTDDSGEANGSGPSTGTDGDAEQAPAPRGSDRPTDPQLAQIQLPEGFQIRMYSADVPGARSLQITPDGTLFVGSRGAGKVYALVDTNNDKRADKVHVLAEGLNNPNGVAFKDGDLYVAEIDKIWRYPEIENHLEDPPEPELISDAFPSKKHHGWKFIKFGPDGKLYIPVGAPCNICKPDPDKYANIQRMNADGSELEVFARGVRNTVGFDWHPETKELWFSDNGRDMLGDTIPPDELNHAPKAGMNFGYPYCHGKDVRDPEFGRGVDCATYVAPVQDLEAHTAALGIEFYTGEMFPATYKKQLFIAEHGSWNRSEKVGYRVTLVRLDADGNAQSYEPFATGWLQDETAWGRPVDVEVMADGSLLVSDDLRGAVYRISYKP